MSNENEGMRLAMLGLLREQGEGAYVIGTKTRDRVVAIVKGLIAETTSDEAKGATATGIALAVLEIHEVLEEI